MAILEKEVEVTLHPRTIKYYEDLGYKIPRYLNIQKELKVKRGTKILIKIDDLPNQSDMVVTKICDNCGNKSRQPFGAITNSRKNGDGKDYCRKCKSIKGQKTRKDNIKHEDSLSFTHPSIAKLLKDPQEGEKLTHGSNQKRDFVCGLCKHTIRNKIVNNVTRHGLSCPMCSDGISYPEKFIMNLLQQIGIPYSREHEFSWKLNRYYDFYIPSKEIIIEAHGKQHYEEKRGAWGKYRSLHSEKKNDLFKEEVAKNNGIINYITIDCRHSTNTHIKREVLNSKLAELFDLSNVNWDECHESAISSLVKDSCELWRKGTKSTKDIATILRIHQGTVIRYLKQGAELGMCDYCPKKSKNKSSKANGLKNRKSVVQLTVDGKFIERFEGIAEAERTTGYRSNISDVCNQKRPTANGFRWMFEKDYEKLLKGEFDLLPLNKRGTLNTKKVIQLSKSKIFLREWNSLSEASESLKISMGNISTVCSGKREVAGGYRWMYLEDYEEYIKNKSN